ncbi:ATP-binding protein, partial [Klebsiella pneumoniae]|nr:ATP-binding protein [Klebsiella pneumoniae]
NLPILLNKNEFDSKNEALFDSKKAQLNDFFESLYLEFNGRELKKSNDLTVSEEEVKSLSGEVNISKSPSAKLSASGT